MMSDDRKNHSMRAILLGACAGGLLLSGTAVADMPKVQPATGAKPMIGTDENVPGLQNLLLQAKLALKRGDERVAIIYLKNAVSLAPRNGNVRAELGYLLLRSGDAVSAERELRQARSDGAPDSATLAPMFQAMLSRGKNQDLLDQFPDPAATDKSGSAADILRARALAYQKLGQTQNANTAMDRSLAVRRDTPALLSRAGLAREQGNVTLANSLTDEALSKTPNDPATLMFKVGLLQQANQSQQALGLADKLVNIAPTNPLSRLTRVSVLLTLKQDAKALEDANALLKQTPNLALAIYYKAVIRARAKDAKGAWQLAQTLPPEVVHSEPNVGLVIGQMALSAGNAETAANIFSSVVSNFPQSTEARMRLGVLQLTQKAPQKTVETLEPIANSKDPRVATLLGEAYAEMHQYSQATKYFEQASAVGFAGPFLKQKLALTELEAGNVQSALQDLKELNDKDPGNIASAGPLIAALMQTHSYDAAQAVADRLVAGSPKVPTAFLYRGRVQIARGDVDGSIASYNTAISLDPKFIPALYYRAQSYAAQGAKDKAKADLQHILAMDPKNTSALLKLAEISAQIGEADKVVPLLQKAVAAAPNDPGPGLILGNYYLAHKQYKPAEQVVSNLLRLLPDNNDANALLGQIQFAEGAHNQASITFRRLVTRAPDSAQAQILLARALDANKDADGARSALEHAVELQPNMLEARGALIQYTLLHGDNDRALAVARDYAQAYPSPSADMLVARTLLTLNQKDQAKAVLTKSLAARPDNQTVILLSRLHRADKDDKGAQAILADWIKHHPDDAVVRTEYGQGLLETKDFAGAKTQFEAVLKTQPYNALVLNNLSWLIQKDDPKRAVILASRAAQVAPEAGSVLDTLAWIKWQQNDRKDVLDLLTRAHKVDPTNPEISYHLVLALDAAGKRSDAKATLNILLQTGTNFDDIANARALAAKWQ
jgi:putative PEP-CTERM system TPR-repeat lipoprotein